MKANVHTTALVALVSGAAATTLQADELDGLWSNETPLLIPAEDDSQHVLDYQLQQALRRLAIRSAERCSLRGQLLRGGR